MAKLVEVNQGEKNDRVKVYEAIVIFRTASKSEGGGQRSKTMVGQIGRGPDGHGTLKRNSWAELVEVN